MIDLCATEDIERNGVRRFVLPDGQAIAVYRLDDGVYATEDLCSHGDASLSEGEVEDGLIVCPFHLGSFDIRTGHPTAAPCSKPVRTFRVAVEGGRILVQPPGAR